MQFAVEVAGEAAPLSLAELVRVLQAAQSSTNNAERQSAGTQLTAWYSYPNFFSSLQTVFLDKSLPRDVRYLAILHLKNGIDKHWRQATAKHAISSEEKAFIRSRVFQGSVDEDYPPFILHNALLAAKLVRIDYPKSWPDAMSTLIQIIRTTSAGIQPQLLGALTVLHYVVKELGSGRLLTMQSLLQAVTPELVQLLGEIYMEKTAYWVDFSTKGGGDEDDADVAMQGGLRALKILRRLVTKGYDNPHTDTMVQQFWSISQTHFDQFLVFVGANSPIPFPYQEVVGKHLLQFAKLHRMMATERPASFPLLPNTLPLVRAYWALVADFANDFEKSGGIKQTTTQGLGGTKSKLEGPIQERLALEGLLLLKACIGIVFHPAHTFVYKNKEQKRVEEQAVQMLKTGLLTNEFVLQAVSIIMTKLFFFRQSDVEAWDENPEDWEVQERDAGEAWEWEVRPCSERVFTDLLIHFKDLLQQPLLQYFATVNEENTDFVKKEAIYTAMGCAAAHVHSQFDFDAFLHNTLVRDAQARGPLAKLLRRRIAILLSQWVPVRIETANRPVVYDIFRHFMNAADETNDEVVRITAARQFKVVVDDFEFRGDAFLPYAPDVLNSLVELLKEASNDDTRLALTETLRAIVQRMDDHVTAFGDGIMSILPQLWGLGNENEFHMKQAVLVIMSTLVMSMKAESVKYQGLMMPLLRDAVDPQTELHHQLGEESCELWKDILLMSRRPLLEDLKSLVPRAFPLLSHHNDSSHMALDIVKSYVMLSPETVLSDEVRQLALRELGGILHSHLQNERVEECTRTLELLIRQAETLGGREGVAVVMQDMMEVHFVRKMMSDLYNAYQSNQTVGPNKVTRRINGSVEKYYFAVLSRLAFADPAMFVDKLATLDNDSEFPQPWTWLLSEWFASFDYLPDVDRAKLSLLALTRLCELPGPMEAMVLDRMQEFISMWTSVRTQLRDGSEPNVVDYDLLVRAPPEPPEWDTPLDELERELTSGDPVYNINAHAFVNTTLQGLIQRAGGQGQFEQQWLVDKVDKEVLAGFEALSRPPDPSLP